MVYDDPYNPHPHRPTTYYSACPSAPCPNPLCLDPRCRAYHYGPYGHPAHRPVSYAAYNGAAAKLRRLSAEARALDDAERRAAQDKVESDAKQKADDIARGKAEREKDAERGVKTREREKERRAGREAAAAAEESDEEWWWSNRRYYYGREGYAGDVLALDGDAGHRRKARYLERRYDSRGGRRSTVVVTRQRAPGWMNCFLD